MVDPKAGGSSPSLCCCVVSLGKKLNSTLSLLTQVYKWVLVIKMLWGNLVIDSSIPSKMGGGVSNIPSCFIL